VQGVLPSGALSLICTPTDGWNGELIVFAHGYVPVTQAPAPHTTGDEVVPFAHELIYLTRVDRSDRGVFLPLPVFRYGHCNFTRDELVGAFLLAVSRP
jgi:hypothetical protein